MANYVITYPGPPKVGRADHHDTAIDSNGVDWFCTVAGTPGTWASASSALTSFSAGTTTATSAPILTALGFTSGVAAQLSDHSRDYVVYLQCTTSGTATSITIGHTSAGTDVTIAGSAAATAGTLYSFRLPAGWYVKWTGTTTAFANQVAVGC